ncbi:zinc ribbon domain-containing protein YjdM [Gilvimarinus sp. SDUM040013]|uniref:Zinc ribbon domain-containing protein YjdM n=1 Tax=Gilvimarinus gilvus TaxID=3058038 RepID=A0ABU4RWH3_9GAMM|nr:zinc ribbon domain-containing protein YjdM [Gilvimarinus sp. SDUM040013]MDO3387315.1 zinc ribbon domain-containing protein YjdM [Gilvimarinus sp. SDUM040013]MDX6849004.1 zinc ribbon domain-containing protein YjdM [Gilvimarinus sp. SDUM040013]
MSLPPCPKCNSEFVYQDQALLICPECAHEWSASGEDSADEEPFVRDSNGNKLVEGDTATLAKDLKVKGTSDVLKVGTKVTIKRIADGDHNIDCKLAKGGDMMLKSEFVKKA